VPEIVIIDKHGPAANWDGTNGHTDGSSILGTTPLEDVGFPYASLLDRSVDEEMLKFSYVAYQIDIGKYAEWVDRSLYPPSHGMLANYYKWVVKKIGLSLTVGTVTAVSLNNEQWSVVYEDTSGVQEILGEGLVITGPGDPHIYSMVRIYGTICIFSRTCSMPK
jgi:mycobactin lysine-N-oxygenase